MHEVETAVGLIIDWQYRAVGHDESSVALDDGLAQTPTHLRLWKLDVIYHLRFQYAPPHKQQCCSLSYVAALSAFANLHFRLFPSHLVC